MFPLCNRGGIGMYLPVIVPTTPNEPMVSFTPILRIGIIERE